MFNSQKYKIVAVPHNFPDNYVDLGEKRYTLKKAQKVVNALEFNCWGAVLDCDFKLRPVDNGK
jgi:hypothetical protein